MPKKKALIKPHDGVKLPDTSGGDLSESHSSQSETPPVVPSTATPPITAPEAGASSNAQAPPPPEPPSLHTTEDLTSFLVDDILSSKPKATPEAILTAENHKRIGRPPGSVNKKGPKAPAKPLWPNGQEIDYDLCHATAEAITSQSLIGIATITGDATFVMGQNPKAKAHEEILVNAWKSHYVKNGIKEISPFWAILLGYGGLIGVHMAQPKTRKNLIKKAKGFAGKVSLGFHWAKEKFFAWRRG